MRLAPDRRFHALTPFINDQLSIEDRLPSAHRGERHHPIPHKIRGWMMLLEFTLSMKVGNVTGVQLQQILLRETDLI